MWDPDNDEVDYDKEVFRQESLWENIRGPVVDIIVTETKCNRERLVDTGRMGTSFIKGQMFQRIKVRLRVDNKMDY